MNIQERRWPAEGLTRIPYWIYSDQDLYADEQARIFRGDAWTFLCLEAELPGPNTFRTANLGDMPVVVTRDKASRSSIRLPMRWASERTRPRYSCARSSSRSR